MWLIIGKIEGKAGYIYRYVKAFETKDSSKKNQIISLAY